MREKRLFFVIAFFIGERVDIRTNDSTLSYNSSTFRFMLWLCTILTASFLLQEIKLNISSLGCTECWSLSYVNSSELKGWSLLSQLVGCVQVAIFRQVVLTFSLPWIHSFWEHLVAKREKPFEALFQSTLNLAHIGAYPC